MPFQKHQKKNQHEYNFAEYSFFSSAFGTFLSRSVLIVKIYYPDFLISETINLNRLKNLLKFKTGSSVVNL